MTSVVREIGSRSTGRSYRLLEWPLKKLKIHKDIGRSNLSALLTEHKIVWLLWKLWQCLLIKTELPYDIQSAACTQRLKAGS